MSGEGMLPVPGGPKMLRETLCVAQHLLNHSFINDAGSHHSARIGELIDALDEMRPLGPDGKHGDRHTDFCGCEDKPEVTS